MDIMIDDQARGIGVVRLTGRLDLLSAADVRQGLAKAMADGHRRLVVDLAKVSFIDSSGLGALVSGLKAARLGGGDLRIAQPNEQARVILELTTLNRVLKPYATVGEALAGYVAS